MVNCLINGLNNNSDSLWFKIKAENSSIAKLDQIFDLSENFKFYDKEENQIRLKFYKDWKRRTPSFLLDTADFIAYFIFTDNTIHLILRKTRNWEFVRDKINDNFEFIEMMKKPKK